MCVKQKPAALVLCTVITLALSSAAFAKSAHHHRHHTKAAAARSQVATASVIHDDRFPFLDQPHAAVHARMSKRSRHQAAGQTITSEAADTYASASFDPLIVEARRYLGTNPTGWRSVWCGAFMDMVLRHTGHRGGGVAAKAYAHYGRRVSGPQVGAIAVMARRGGGGHVGIVTGIDPHGNPIIISGNYNHKVVEAAFPRGSIFAYVVPN
ncbi:MAG TPA: TIGR02594 family protein [Pseudolabrys sp.]|nr:TIGR02594 family protein [Pseudolabrys sp.]